MEWNRSITGFGGSRWKCWEEHIKDRVDMTFAVFKDEVVRHNPALRNDGWVFKPDKEYRLPSLDSPAAVGDVAETLIEPEPPYISQVKIGHTDGRYWGSDPDRNDDTPDGCWMNEPRSGDPFGREARGCPGPMDRGCIRPGACNVTSLCMLMRHHRLTSKPTAYPDGRAVSAWLEDEPFSPTWLYVYMMDSFGAGQQVWDGNNPVTAGNSRVVARGDFMREVIRKVAESIGNQADVVYTTNTTWAEYRSAIDNGSPVVVNSARLSHVILGVGYACERDTHWMIAHDPYGRRTIDLRRWESYNACGEDDTHGKGVRYPFSKLECRYLLYCRGLG